MSPSNLSLGKVFQKRPETHKRVASTADLYKAVFLLKLWWKTQVLCNFTGSTKEQSKCWTQWEHQGLKRLAATKSLIVRAVQRLNESKMRKHPEKKLELCKTWNRLRTQVDSTFSPGAFDLSGFRERKLMRCKNVPNVGLTVTRTKLSERAARPRMRAHRRRMFAPINDRC